MSRTILALCCALFLTASCVPDEPERDTTRVSQYNDETVMGKIQATGVLRVGIQPVEPWASDDGESGFSAELGRLVARRLGVDVEYVPATSLELVTMVEEFDLYIAFPLLPVTERRVRKPTRTFADPVFIGHQRLLVMDDGRGDAPTAPEDLAGGRVCSIIDPLTGVSLDEIDPSIEVVTSNEPLDCARKLRRGRVDAVTGPDVVLAGLAAELGDGARVAGQQINTEGYAPMIVPGARGWRDFLDRILRDAELDGTWTRAYEDAFDGLIERTPPEPPSLTIEEAAALFPRESEPESD